MNWFITLQYFTHRKIENKKEKIDLVRSQSAE